LKPGTRHLTLDIFYTVALHFVLQDEGDDAAKEEMEAKKARREARGAARRARAAAQGPSEVALHPISGAPMSILLAAENEAAANADGGGADAKGKNLHKRLYEVHTSMQPSACLIPGMPVTITHESGRVHRLWGGHTGVVAIDPSTEEGGGGGVVTIQFIDAETGARDRKALPMDMVRWRDKPAPVCCVLCAVCCVLCAVCCVLCDV
jgi:hypothetical protein